MPDQEMKQQEEQEPLAPQANAAARAPDTEAGPEAEEIETEATSEAKEEDELTPEERGLQMIRKHQQAYRQRIEDAKARIRTRAEWRRMKRLGQTYRYTVQPGDTLETVAKIFYAKPERWPEIYEANAGRVPEPGDEGPQPLEPGTELVIP